MNKDALLTNTVLNTYQTVEKLNDGVLKFNSDGTANTLDVLTNAMLNDYQTITDLVADTPTVVQIANAVILKGGGR